MQVAVAEGGGAAAWTDGRAGAHVARAARSHVWGHTEAGHGCPISMTYAVVPALRHEPALAARYEPLLASRVYDPGLREPTGKRGLLAGMGMTEKQGGSDVRANATTATPTGESACSRCAATSGSPRRRCATCSWCSHRRPAPFLLPGAEDPAGQHVQHVPDPAVEGQARQPQQRLLGAGVRRHARWLVGPEGRGVRVIIEMVACTRLDVSVGSAALMRKAFVERVTTPGTAPRSAGH